MFLLFVLYANSIIFIYIFLVILIFNVIKLLKMTCLQMFHISENYIIYHAGFVSFISFHLLLESIFILNNI